MSDRAASAPSSSTGAYLNVRRPSLSLEVPVLIETLPVGPTSPPPLSEQTSTMVVFGDGAILRLGVSVVNGQCLKVTNLRSKAEMLCRVVSSKSNPNGKPLVEIAFFNRALGFWGVNFPETAASNRPAVTAVAQPTDLSQPQASVTPAAAGTPVSHTPAPAPIAKVPIVPPASLQVKNEVDVDEPGILEDMQPLADPVEKREITLPLDAPAASSRLRQRYSGPRVGDDHGEISVPTGTLRAETITAGAPAAVLAQVPVHVREMTLLTREEKPKRSRGPYALGACLLALMSAFAVYFLKGMNAENPDPGSPVSTAAFTQPAPAPTPQAPADQTVSASPAPSQPIEPTQVPVPATSLNPAPAASGKMSPVPSAGAGGLQPSSSAPPIPEPPGNAEAQNAPRKQLTGIRAASPQPVIPRAPSMDAAAPEVTIAPPEAQPSGLNHLGKVNSPAVPLPASAAGSQPPQPASSNLVLPKLKSSVAPVYPMEARRNSIAGDVVLDTLITEKGKVTDVKVVSGPVLLRQAAISAVQMWVYEPARLNGKPTAMRMNVTIKFLR